MPYLVMAADEIDRGIWCGPTFFGDARTDKELVADLDGFPSGNDDADEKEENNFPFFETRKSPCQVLGILEGYGYQVLSISTPCDDHSTGSFIWTLHKPLPGMEDDDMDVSTISADSVDNKLEFELQYGKVQKIRDALKKSSDEYGVESNRIAGLFEIIQKCCQKYTKYADAAASYVDKKLLQFGEDQRMTPEEADEVVELAKQMKRQVRTKLEETNTKIGKYCGELLTKDSDH